MHNWKQIIWKHHKHLYLKEKKIKAMKNKVERTWNTWLLNGMCDSGLVYGPEEKRGKGKNKSFIL